MNTKNDTYELKADRNTDDFAFIAGINFVNFKFEGRHEQKMYLDIQGIKMVNQLIQVMPFDPYRKKMSILIKNPQGQHILYMKGADNVIMPEITMKKARKQEIQE